MGSRAPWTDHEKNVWARDSRTISSLDIGSAAVRTVIGHLEAGPVSSGGTPRAITPRRPVDVSARASVPTAAPRTLVGGGAYRPARRRREPSACVKLAFGAVLASELSPVLSPVFRFRPRNGRRRATCRGHLRRFGRP